MSFRSFILFVLSLLWLCTTGQPSWSGEDSATFDELARQFRDPPADYRPAPLWVWHDKVSKSMIERDLIDLKAKGFGGVFIHPRYGLITEYLSEEWFDLVEHTLNKSQQLGLRTWIYDENSFPSGFAGGYVPAEMPESYNQGQGLLMKSASVIPEDLPPGTIVLEGTGPFADVTRSAKAGDKGNFLLFEKVSYAPSKWHAGYSYVDLLVPGVTEKFIEVTMRGYEDVLGDYFGTDVPGVFTDEPNIRPPRAKSIRWTPALFDEFQERWCYNLKTHLPSLFEEVGDWKRVRHNHYQLLLELFIRHWSKPWHAYTEERNLQWTGHYWEHGWPNPEHGGDNMAMYAWHQMPGIDMLFNTMDQDSVQFGNVRAVKELSSVANQMGRQRTLSETYGGAGWELRFEDMRRLGEWQYVLGVNFMNQHLTYMNLTGDRKHDFPQGICYQAPWWRHYRVLNDHFSRLSVALAHGRQINKILVIVPTSTTWMYYSPTKPNDRLQEIGDSFHKFLTTLERYHVEYDLGCENIIKDHGGVENGKFVVGQCEYNLVVVPPLFENFDAPTLELVRKYLDSDGKVVAFTDNLTTVDGRSSKRIRELTKQKNWQAVSSLAEAQPLLIGDSFRMLDPENVGGSLLHQRRAFADGQLIFLANSSLKEKATGAFATKGGSALRLDTFTGNVQDHPTVVLDDRVKISFDLAPGGSSLLFVKRKGGHLVEPPANLVREVVPTATSTIKRLAPNMLALDYCDIKLKDATHTGNYFYTAGTKIWQAHGFRDNPWVSSVQWKSDWVNADTFGSRTGFDARYPFEVDEGVDLQSLQAVVEQPELWKVQINGRTIEPKPQAWAIDKTFGVFDLSEDVKFGRNEISLCMHPMSIYAEIAPVYIVGDFDLRSQPQGWKLVKQTPMELVSWKKQGLPFYPYDVSYKKTVTLAKHRKVCVELGPWEGTVAEVRVNGKHAGIIGWQPYQIDITEYTNEGENTIEVIVTGSLKNLLGPHHNVKRRGIVTPWSFKYAPRQQPAGTDYDSLDYGLLADYAVVIYR